MRDGSRIPWSVDAPFKDREVRFLFVNGEKELWVHGSVAQSLSPLKGLDERTRRCVLRLLVHLRPAMTGSAGDELDEFVRESMRDKDREVRRDATAVARVAATECIQTELAARLRERLRMNPPIMFSVVTGLGFVFGLMTPLILVPHVRWAVSLSLFVNALFILGGTMSARTGKHRITSDDYFETLVAMEAVAGAAPEKLRQSVPELRKLAGPGAVSPEVRAKARELLTKVHEATLHELPIAAEPPQRDAASLPVAAMRDERG
jgi:hypothetical protein